MKHHHRTRVQTSSRPRRSPALSKKPGFSVRCPPEPSDRVRISPWTLAAVCLLGLSFAWIAGCSDRPSADSTAPAPAPVPAAAPDPALPRSDNTASVDAGAPSAKSAAAGSSEVAGGPASTAPAADQPPSAPAEPAQASRREPLFVGWPKPILALYLTGEQHGYIEPCGCSGLTNQKGGLVRRFACKRQLEQQGWEVVALDVGNQVSRFGRQAEIKFQMTAEGLKKMKYRAIGFGPDDLRLSAGELVAVTAEEGDASSPFVCANAAIIDRALTPRYHVIEAAGKKIGVTAVLGTEELAQITSDEIIKKPAEEALREVWPELEKKACDLYVLLAHASLSESAELAKKVPHFNVVVTAGGVGEPTYEAEKIAGTNALMVQVGTKGMYVGVIGVFDDPAQPLRYQRVPLDDRFPDSREMLQLLTSYRPRGGGAGGQGECRECREGHPHGSSRRGCVRRS